MLVNLFKNKIEQIREILVRMIEILKVSVKENVENQLKLIQTLN